MAIQIESINSRGNVEEGSHTFAQSQFLPVKQDKLSNNVEEGSNSTSKTR